MDNDVVQLLQSIPHHRGGGGELSCELIHSLPACQIPHLLHVLMQARMGNHEGRGKALRLAIDPVRFEALGFEDGTHPIIYLSHFCGTPEQIFADTPGEPLCTMEEWRRHL